MTAPITAVGKFSIVARTPSSEPCSPAPSIRIPMPRSRGQVVAIVFKGTVSDWLQRASDVVRMRMDTGGLLAYPISGQLEVVMSLQVDPVTVRRSEVSR